MTIGERIDVLLTEHRVYKEWLAKESRKAVSTINRWLSGKKKTFKEREAQAIAQAFNITLESFLEGVEGMEKKEDGEKQGATKRTLLQYPATLMVEKFSGRIVEDEFDPAGNGSEVRTLEVIPFQTVPSKVYFQEICSIQITEEEWRGVRVAIERPCYREEERETLVTVIRDVKEVLGVERKEMIMKTGQDLFGSATEINNQ